MKKLRVGILFGGRSGEHEVSLLSAASVFNAIDKTKYEVVPIGITKEGRWLTAADAERLLQGKRGAESGSQTHLAQSHLSQAHLRAGDPEATPGAAVLARGEAVMVPPEPQRQPGSLTPFQTEARSRNQAWRSVGSPTPDRAVWGHSPDKRVWRDVITSATETAPLRPEARSGTGSGTTTVGWTVEGTRGEW